MTARLPVALFLALFAHACAQATNAAPFDGGADGGPCASSCEACGLAYCRDRCLGIHRDCLEIAGDDCVEIRRCIMGPLP